MDSIQRKHFFAVLGKHHSLFKHQCCLHPSASKEACNGRSRAHTIQRSGILESIAHDGHVAQLKPSMNLDYGPRLAERVLVGVREATTFPGICNRHDSELFRPIETEPITFRHDQVFLFAYRSLLREYFTKLQAQNQLKYMKLYFDKHKVIRNKFTENYLEGNMIGTDHGFDALTHHKAIYDNLLLTSRYDEMRYVAFKYDRHTPILCAGAFSPEYTYGGRILQDLSDLSFIQEFISFSIWSIDGRGVALLAWHRTSDKSCKPFVESLLQMPKRRLPAILTSLAFEHSENVVFSPTWWEAIPRRNKLIFARRMGGGLPLTERNKNYLNDDGNTAISAQVSEIIDRSK